MPKKSKKPKEEEPEPEPEPEEQVEEEDEDEDEEEDKDENGTSKEEREQNARRRKRAVARRKGYRSLATKGGYSMTVASTDASRDVAQNILTIKETIRACKWAPALPESGIAYENFDEFTERLKLSQQEPLASGPAAVFRASGEVFLRKVVNEAIQRTFDAGKTRVSLNTLVSVLRPLQPVLTHSFMAPTGLVRHAQTTMVGAEGNQAPALGVLESDDAQITKERKLILPKQIEFAKAVAKAVAESKKSKGEPGDRKKIKKNKNSNLAAA
tara:strand:- start:896 stop:1705 length:810 start_codon:yes stop_codon:yes gene_type:complete